MQQLSCLKFRSRPDFSLIGPPHAQSFNAWCFYARALLMIVHVQGTKVPELLNTACARAVVIGRWQLM